MILENIKAQDYKMVKRLYISAFPPEERQPFFLLKSKAKSGKAQLLVAKENEKFIGFIYLIEYLDMVYIIFFAVSDAVRGSGYGSKILSLVKKQKSGKRIFLAREPLLKTAENYEQRVNRHNFYIKNGFTDFDFKIEEMGCLFETMGIGGNITAAEYDALIDNWCGSIFRKLLKMRLIEK